MTHESDPAAPLRASLREALQRELLADIPLTRALQLRLAAWDGQSLAIGAPLAPNINDKGCAFGGSLASVMTLAGWAFVKLSTQLRRLDCDIYVQDSTIRYLAPVWGDFTATARPDPDERLEDFLAALAARGKARLTLRCEVPAADGSAATTLVARFVALAAAHAPKPRDAAQCADAPA